MTWLPPRSQGRTRHTTVTPETRPTDRPEGGGAATSEGAARGGPAAPGGGPTEREEMVVDADEVMADADLEGVNADAEADEAGAPRTVGTDERVDIGSWNK